MKKKMMNISFEMKNGKIVSNKIFPKEDFVVVFLEHISTPSNRWFAMKDSETGNTCVINLSDVSFVLIDNKEESGDSPNTKED